MTAPWLPGGATEPHESDAGLPARGTDLAELPDDLRDTEMVAKVLLSHSWQMSKEIGMVFQVTDLQVRSSSAECPFDDSGAFEDSGAFGGA